MLPPGWTSTRANENQFFFSNRDQTITVQTITQAWELHRTSSALEAEALVRDLEAEGLSVSDLLDSLLLSDEEVIERLDGAAVGAEGVDDKGAEPDETNLPLPPVDDLLQDDELADMLGKMLEDLGHADESDEGTGQHGLGGSVNLADPSSSTAERAAPSLSSTSRPSVEEIDADLRDVDD